MNSFARRWLLPLALAFALGGAFVVGGVLLGRHFQNQGFEIVGIVLAFAVPVSITQLLTRKSNDGQSPNGSRLN